MGDILGVTEANVLSEVRALSKVRILRRIGLSLHHLRLGYAANALTAFDAQEDRLVALRKGVGGFASVSHCYIRETSPEWPWNLYAVFHGTDRERCLRAVEAFRSRFSLGEPKVLFSLKEYKKSRWFLDEIDPPDPGHPA
jgi:DNA-binding Lrp family transcriptional regulator